MNYGLWMEFRKKSVLLFYCYIVFLSSKAFRER
jgi:hypothetical protein